MGEKQLTVGDMFNSGFDPMTIDTSEIRKLSNAIPQDGNIDTNNAEVLATQYLRGADLCAEMLAIATAYAQKTDALKKSAYSHAALVKSKNSGIKTDKSRAWFADSDPDYIEACNKHAEATAFVKWINSKYDSFIRAHYMCKKILDRAYPHENTGGFNTTTPENTW